MMQLPRKLRWFVTVVGLVTVFAFGPALTAAERGQRIVEATYKVTDGQTAATCFLLTRPSADGAKSQILLVTAAHVLENFKGDEAKLILRTPKAEGEIEPTPWPLKIRQADQPMWQKHPQADVAAMAIQPPEELLSKTLPIELLATQDAWNQHAFEPGDFVRLVGYPHAMQFDPNPQGYPVTRLGVLAGFPNRPSDKSRLFLIDVNVFEGDSGGPIYWLGDPPEAGGPRPLLILGLLHGQHFLNEGFRTVYQSGETRHRLGVGIGVHAVNILETLEQVPKS